jgi:hypothetical protein
MLKKKFLKNNFNVIKYVKKNENILVLLESCGFLTASLEEKLKICSEISFLR